LVCFIAGCGRPNVPAVYTRISGFANWIQTGICDLSSDPPTSCIATFSPTSDSTTIAPISITTAIPTGAPSAYTKSNQPTMKQYSSSRPVTTPHVTITPSFAKTVRPTSKSFPSSQPIVLRGPTAMPFETTPMPTTAPSGTWNPSRNYDSVKRPSPSPTGMRESPTRPVIIVDDKNDPSDCRRAKSDRRRNKVKHSKKRADDTYICGESQKKAKIEKKPNADNMTNKRNRMKRNWIFKAPQQAETEPIQTVFGSRTESSTTDEASIKISNIFIRNIQGQENIS
jgi:hypothetical protein